MHENEDVKDKLALNTLQVTMDQVKDDIAAIRYKLDKMEEIFVTRKEFNPIQKLVYGLTGTVLTAVVYAVLNLVLKK